MIHIGSDHLMDSEDRRRVMFALVALGLVLATAFFVSLWLAVPPKDIGGELVAAPAAASSVAGASLAQMIRAWREVR